MDFLSDVLLAAFQIFYLAFFFGAMGILFLVPLAVVVYTFVDIFNRDDIGAGKLVWSLVVLMVPLAGLGIYWLSRPAGQQAPSTTMSMHRATPASETEAQTAPPRAA